MAQFAVCQQVVLLDWTPRGTGEYPATVIEVRCARNENYEPTIRVQIHGGGIVATSPLHLRSH